MADGVMMLRIIVAAVAVLVLGLITGSAQASTPTPPPCDGRFGPIGDLAEPRVALEPLDAGIVLVQWIIPLVGEDPTCFVVERRVGDGEFEVAALVSYRTGWRDPTDFDGPAEITYSVFAANNKVRSEADEETISIPSHTSYVTPSTTLRGDVDCDLDVDTGDAVPLLAALAGMQAAGMSESCYLEPVPGEVFDQWHRWGRTDFNCDGLASASDIIVLLRYVAELPLNLHRFCDASWPSN